MKKLCGLFVCMLAAFVTVANVQASDLSGKVKITGSDYVKIKGYEYDDADDVTKVTLEVTADEDFINEVLNHKPGTGASFATYNFGFTPELDGSSFKKISANSNNSIAEAKSSVDSKIESESPSNSATVWPGIVYVTYIKPNERANYVTAQFNGSKTIKEALMEALEVDSEDDLVYGKNYYFITVQNYIVWGWSFDSKKEYINLIYDVNYPIFADFTTSGIFYPTLKSALSSGYAKIVVNEDTTVDEDMTVSARTTLVINKSLEVASGSTLTIKGTLKVSNDATIKLSDDAEIIFEGEGKIVNEDNDELYIITTESNNGQVSTDSNLVKAGEEVTVTTEANDGYKLKSLKVINLSTNEEVEVKDNKFSMPESNVKVIAEFEKLEDISVPNTLDNISSSLVLGLVSVIGIVGLICIFKRKLQN